MLRQILLTSSMEQLDPMHKRLTISLALLAIIVAVFVTYKYVQAPEIVQPRRMTLSGEYTCLPFKDSISAIKECIPALKTDNGKYYTIDPGLMSQLPPQVAMGDRIEGTGMMTPVEMLSTEHWRKYNITGLFSVTDSMKKLNAEPISYTCDQDGKICPDGSTVGRTGSDCNFRACPAPEAITTTLTTSMGQMVTGMHVSITPNKIVSDSRCPQSVQCIWAGTVEVKATSATEVSHGESTYKLGEPRTFGIYNITLTDVTPYPKEPGTIATSSYRFTFRVDKK